MAIKEKDKVPVSTPPVPPTPISPRQYVVIFDGIVDKQGNLRRKGEIVPEDDIEVARLLDLKAIEVLA